MATQPIYQFYSELADYEPKIWRRFQVLQNITMARLCYILMTMYEIKGSHPFELDASIHEGLQKHYEIHMGEDDFFPVSDVPTYDAAAARLGRQFIKPEATLAMQYDHGDGWKITLTLEDILCDERLPGRELPRVLNGEGYGIIEDCGGPGGLERLAIVSQQKSGRDYEELLTRLRRDKFDLTAFDKDDMNFRLKKVPRIYRDKYEYGYEPSKRSVALLERKKRRITSEAP